MAVSDSDQVEHRLHADSTVGGTTAVLHTGGLQFASEKAVLEKALGARPGVLSVEANPVAQTATVRYDPRQTNVAELSKWVEECGYHCAGKSVPNHICSPMEEARNREQATQPPGTSAMGDQVWSSWCQCRVCRPRHLCEGSPSRRKA